MTNANVSIGNTASAWTGSNGAFTVQIDQPGTYPVTIEAPGFHTSNSEIEIKTQSAFTNLFRKVLPADTNYFDLNFYDHVFRTNGTTGTKRWTTTPAVEIWTKKMKCLVALGNLCLQYEVTATPTPIHFESLTRAVVNIDFPQLTGNVISGVNITTKSHPTGTILNFASELTSHTIYVANMTRGSTSFGGAAYAGTASTGGNVAGQITGSEIHLNSYFQADKVGTYRHELAHALGWNHPSVAAGSLTEYDSMPRRSVMERPGIISSWDKSHGAILYTRPAGSASPDTDPTGSSVQ